MKNIFFEEKDFIQEDFNPLEILNAFQQLNKSSKHSTLPILPISINLQPKLQHSEQVDHENMKQQFDQISYNSKGQAAESMPKKTYIIKKQMIKQYKQQKAQHNQNSTGRISNFSKSQDFCEENRLTLRKSSFMQNNLIKPKNFAQDEKQFNNFKLSQEIKELEMKYRRKQEELYQQKIRLTEHCSKILQQSTKKKLKFLKFLSHQNSIKDLIFQQQITKRYQSLINYLSEQAKLKGKRGKKNQTQEQDNKSIQMIVKKSYVSFLANKLSKEKQKYGTIRYNQFEPTLSELSFNRIQQLKKHQFFSNYCLLCSIEAGMEQVEQILCMDMNKLQECTISCLKYSPIVAKHKRAELFESLKQINSQAKRLTSSSPNVFFPNRVNLFIPISNIYSTQDQIFIVNERNENYNLLYKFLNRIDFLPAEQGMAVLKYVLAMSFKLLEQVENNKISAIVIPKMIFLNEKHQVKFKNLIFNQLMYHHFRHLYHQEDRYFFPPQQNAQTHAATLWSIGMLAYTLYFNSKPFPKYVPYSWPSRQYFFVMNQIQYPSKSPANEKIRQLIHICLTANNTTKSVPTEFLDLLNIIHSK